MATHIQLSQILTNLILSSAGDMVNISKTTFANIKLQEKHVASKSFTNPYTADHLTSFIQLASSVEVVPIQFSSKPIIKPWEEIQSNQNQCSLGYVKDNDNLHIPNY